MKKVYISYLLHGNMCYDRYTKQEIRAKFPDIYAVAVRAMHRFPQVTAHIDFPGLTTLSLRHHARWFLDELRPLVTRGQVVMLGCQYAASQTMCSDEESDLVAGRVSMDILRDEFGVAVDAYFPQEISFHPQLPYTMRAIGAKHLVVGPDWPRPRVVTGIDGSTVIVYPRAGSVDPEHAEDALETLYDAHQDGDFVLVGGDFEMLGNVDRVVQAIDALASKGKVIEWTTVQRHDKENGTRDACAAPTPFRQSPEDEIPSPSFSRWVGDPEDMIWHGYAVAAMDAIRTAGFARLCANLHGLGIVDPPVSERRTTAPDNGWDHWFEHVLEYPETETRYLAEDGIPTIYTRAWHQLLIGLNSDASGWYPWQPRTRHRNLALQTSESLSKEIVSRFAERLAPMARPVGNGATAHVVALNPLPARKAEVSFETPIPMRLVGGDGEPIPTLTQLQNGRWKVRARVDLPAYGYSVFGLAPTQDIHSLIWEDGASIDFAGRHASLEAGHVTVSHGEGQVEVSVPPFLLSDPSGVADTERVTPTWDDAKTRTRVTPFGRDLEVFSELAWCVWLRLVIALRKDRIEITAEIHVDMPRRFGALGYDPEGLLLAFHGQRGNVDYDVPYATIQHPNDGASFVAVQRFAALASPNRSFGIVSLGGNQAYKVASREGYLAASLGASTQGRPDTRPECYIREDGTAEHRITSGGDPFTGSYTHRFALVFSEPAVIAAEARRLRTAVPVVFIEPGGGDWPSERSLLSVTPDSAYVTAFRITKERCEVTVNDLSGSASETAVSSSRGERRADLVPYGIATVEI